jgi:hypothetical protein
VTRVLARRRREASSHRSVFQPTQTVNSNSREFPLSIHVYHILFREYLMKQKSKAIRSIWTILTVAIVAIVSSSNLQAALVYWNNFDDVVPDGVPEVTPGGGTIAVNTTGANLAVFAPSAGAFGGRMAATANPNDSTAGTAGAATAFTGGTTIANLPNQTGGGAGSMNQFTVSFWYNASTFRTGSTSITHRLLAFGDSAATDVAPNPGVGFHIRNNGAGSGGTPNPRTIALNANAIDVSAAGAGSGFEGTAVSTGTWAFVALTYDGTSSNGDNSAAQSTATAAASSVNGQLYWGTSALAVTRFDAPLTSVAGDATALSLGAMNFGNAAQLILANNLSQNRSFDGSIDDIRIYDGVLSAGAVENIRQEGLIGIPEPSAIVLSGLMASGLAVIQIRRKK